MNQSIIIPLDGSDLGERALTFATYLANQAASTTLIHVVPRPEAMCPDPRVQHGGPSMQAPIYGEGRTARACQIARTYLDDLISRHGFPPGTESLVAVGDPVTQILALARRLENPLVVMVTIDDLTRGPKRLGSVPRRLLASGQVSVIGIPAAIPEGQPDANAVPMIQDGTPARLEQRAARPVPGVQLTIQG